MKVTNILLGALVIVTFIPQIYDIAYMRSQLFHKQVTYTERVINGIKYIIFTNECGQISTINFTIDSIEIEAQKRLYK